MSKNAIHYKIDSDEGDFSYSVLLNSKCIEAIHHTTNTNKKGPLIVDSIKLPSSQHGVVFDIEIEQLQWNLSIFFIGIRKANLIVDTNEIG
jgi:hypothetical protein